MRLLCALPARWMYLFRAVDSGGQTVDFYLSETRDREAAKIFLRRALANADNRPPGVFARDGLRSYPAAIRDLQEEGHLHVRCRQRTRKYCNNRIESDHRHVKRRLRAMPGATDDRHGVGSDSRHRGGTDSQRAGSRDNTSQPVRANVGIRSPTEGSIAPTASELTPTMLRTTKLQHFRRERRPAVRLQGCLLCRVRAAAIPSRASSHA